MTHANSKKYFINIKDFVRKIFVKGKNYMQLSDIIKDIGISKKVH